MDFSFKPNKGIPVAAIAGIALAAACLLPSHVQADSWDKMSKLTVDQPTQVGNIYLQPGTYMFRLLDWDRHIVAITNGDRSKPYGIVMAVPAYRPVVNGNEPIFTYWETPPGTAKAVRYWYWPSDHDGQEFRYPAHLQTIAAVTTAAAAPAPQPPAPIAAQAAPQPEPAPAPQAEVTPAPAPQPEEQQQEVIIAQNNPPPPAPAAQQPAPAPPEADQTPTLPQTASPYPMIGLGGLLSLGLYLALRATRFGLR